jgi:hypothetical protein
VRTWRAFEDPSTLDGYRDRDGKLCRFGMVLEDEGGGEPIAHAFFALDRVGDSPLSVVVRFSAVDHRRAWDTCLRATSHVIDAAINRAVRDRPLVLTSHAEIGDAWLRVRGAGSWDALCVVFGPAYTELIRGG